MLVRTNGLEGRVFDDRIALDLPWIFILLVFSGLCHPFSLLTCCIPQDSPSPGGNEA